MTSCMICNKSVTVAANPAQESTVQCECDRLVAALSDDDHRAADARKLTILAIDLDD